MALLLFGSAAETDFGFLVGTPDDQIDFTSVLGTVADAYQAVPPFPSAWGWNPATGLLTVRKNTAALWSGVVQALEGAGSFSTVSFSISVQAHVRYIGPDPPNRTDPVGAVITYNAAAIFIGASSFAIITGSLPDGLTLNATTGMITGTLTTAETRPSITIQGTGSADASQAPDFIWTVTAVLSPPVATMSTIPDQSIALGSAIASVNLSTYFTGATSYSISPAVAGLSVASSTLSGTPSAAGTYRITPVGTNGDGSTNQKPFTLRVSSAAPSFSGSVGTVTAVAGQPITPVQFSSFFTGVVASYSISLSAAALAALGLTFDTASGALAGAIATIGSTSGVTVTATNAGGSASTGSFTITGTAPGASTEKFDLFQMLVA